MLDQLIPPSDVAAPSFLIGCGVLAIGMLIWDTVEVGRNDAANLVNAVFGARILTRRTAVYLAGLGVILGASAASPVIETTRRGIFDPSQLTLEMALTVYISVYVVDTVLLYGYSAFGMPVSTTACLVFELLGASLALGGSGIVHWNRAGIVVSAIVLSILISGTAGFFIQRMVRGAIGSRGNHLGTLLLHGGWFGGGMLAGLGYFMIVKGMKGVAFVQAFNEEVVQAYGTGFVVLFMWALLAIAVHACLMTFREKAARWLLPVLAMIGTLCMGFAFGQNDLANCASPGLASIHLIRHADQSVGAASKIDIATWLLVGCGVLLFLGMMTKNAQRVTRAAVNTGSMSHNVGLYAPRWCITLARTLIKYRGRAPSIAPPAARTEAGERLHYDPLRACVILAVSASVIATASSLGLPVSTTYVAFAAVVATGAADRILRRGDGDLKLARTIWVVFSWFAAAMIAALATGIICRAFYHLGLGGIIGGLVLNLLLRRVLKKRGDAQEERIHEQARERMYPEEFTEYEG